MKPALQWQVHRSTTLLALVLLPLLLTLGNWQLRRAEEKRVAQNELTQRAAQPPIDIEDLGAAPAAYTRVRVSGQYDSARNFLLDNRVHEGRFGYEVVTSFQPQHSGVKLLVDRGWVQGDAGRRQRPSIDAIAGSVVLTGTLYRDTGTYQLGELVDEGQWPKLIQNLRTDELQQLLGEPVYPFVLRLDADAPGAYIVNWRIFNPGFGPERHIAYAVTWFAMAFTLVMAWLLSSSSLWQFLRGKLNDDK